MTQASRITKIGLLILGLGLLAPASWAQKCPPAAEKIAQAYGIDSFGQIDAVRSTFNIDFPGLKVAQSWIWEPKTDRVTYEGKDQDGNPVKVSYVRSQLASQPDRVQKQIDPSFNNNQYWLFLPFHACWDTAAREKPSVRLFSARQAGRFDHFAPALQFAVDKTLQSFGWRARLRRQT